MTAKVCNSFARKSIDFFTLFGFYTPSLDAYKLVNINLIL
jgi:hypothetical protein